MQGLLLLLSILTIYAFGTQCPTNNQQSSSIQSLSNSNNNTPKNLKVAFLGDQGLGQNPANVMKMIRDWNADAMVSVGDFDYEDSPDQFIKMIDSVFEPTFPIFAVVGNHDIVKWGGDKGYSAQLQSRLNKSGVLSTCSGDFGVNGVCRWNGLQLLLSGVGTLGRDHAAYLESNLQSSVQNPALWQWNICVWHKNQRLYQTGDKMDETGYAVYDTCRKHGAMIITAHQHLYARTKLMSDYESHTVAKEKFYPQDYEENMTVQRHHNRHHRTHLKRPLPQKQYDLLTLSPGFSYAAVVGLGGKEVRPWQAGLEKNPWWSAGAALDV